jgi:hypothetical protein
MRPEQLVELVLQSVQHERTGIAVYRAALACAIHADLRAEWIETLEQTREHEQTLIEICKVLGIDPEHSAPGREIVAEVGGSLVRAIERATVEGDREVAQLVACECVVHAGIKAQLDWGLLRRCAEELVGDEGQPLPEVFEEIEQEKRDSLDHAQGWWRELWVDSLGMKAVLPPPEVRKRIESASDESARDRAR